MVMVIGIISGSLQTIFNEIYNVFVTFWRESDVLFEKQNERKIYVDRALTTNTLVGNY